MKSQRSNIRLWKSKHFANLFLAITLLAVAYASLSLAAGHDDLFLKSAFSDPDKIVEMPDDWKNRPIRRPSTVADADVYMTLTYPLYDLFEPKLQRFAHDEGFTINIKKSVCGTSTRMLMSKELDIACFCCSPTAGDRLPGVKFHAMGILPVVIMVNEENPISNLSLDNVMKIFRGEIVNWAQLGGSDLLIQPVARLHCNSRPGRWRPLDSHEELSPNTLIVGGIMDNQEFVKRTPGSIGYGSLSDVLMSDKDNNVKIIKVDGFSPTDLATIARGDYPYYRSYIFTTWEGDGQRNPLAHKVIDFISSEINDHGDDIGIVATRKLMEEGWQFYGEDLSGEPFHDMEPGDGKQRATHN